MDRNEIARSPSHARAEKQPSGSGIMKGRSDFWKKILRRNGATGAKDRFIDPRR